MKRTWLLVALAAGVAAPASAQLIGMPVWNSPTGGSGLTINGDYGKPNSNYFGGGSAFGGRATLGLGTLSVTAGAASFSPSPAGASKMTSFGGDVAFRVIGGPLVPVKINIQGGAAHTSADSGFTVVTGAVGIGLTLPMPGISIEPYVSPGVRYYKSGFAGTSASTKFGFVVGANVGFGMLGVHIAYDHSQIGTPGGNVNVSTFGIGAHLALKVPMGM